MSTRQILYKNIPRNIFQRGWSISFPRGVKDIYFKLNNDCPKFWEIIESVKKLPAGVVHIDPLGESNYLRVSYYPKEITEEDIISFVRTIEFKDC